MSTQLRNDFDGILLMLPKHTTSCYIVERAVEYIKKHYMDPLTLPEVAEYVGVTPNYLCKCFQKHTEMKFTAYVNSVRVRQAQILLLTTPMRVAGISDAVGYADPSYFIRLFRQYTDYTPMQFRNLFYRYHSEIFEKCILEKARK